MKEVRTFALLVGLTVAIALLGAVVVKVETSIWNELAYEN